MEVGDEIFDPLETIQSSRIYSAARKMKKRYGMQFRGIGTLKGVHIIRVESDSDRWALMEINRLFSRLRIGGDIWIPDGLLGDAAAKKVEENPDWYVSHRDGDGLRIYRLA